MFDFEGTGPEVFGNTNAPPAVTYSAIIYSLRCMVRQEIPLNQVLPCWPPATEAILGACVLRLFCSCKPLEQYCFSQASSGCYCMRYSLRCGAGLHEAHYSAHP